MLTVTVEWLYRFESSVLPKSSEEQPKPNSMNSLSDAFSDLSLHAVVVNVDADVVIVDAIVDIVVVDVAFHFGGIVDLVTGSVFIIVLAAAALEVTCEHF